MSSVRNLQNMFLILTEQEEIRRSAANNEKMVCIRFCDLMFGILKGLTNSIKLYDEIRKLFDLPAIDDKSPNII